MSRYIDNNTPNERGDPDLDALSFLAVFENAYDNISNSCYQSTKRIRHLHG